jgi:dephospho-CoA kinase
VVAVIGPRAAGKDELAHYLRERYGVPAIEIGRFARELAGEAGDNRAHRQHETVARELAEYGTGTIMTRLLAEVTESGQPRPTALVITGVYTPAEARALKAHFGRDLLLAYIKVGDLRARYRRAQERDFPSEADDFQSFQEEDKALQEERALARTAELADTTLWNDGTLEQFWQQIEANLVPHLLPAAGRDQS